MNQALPKNDGIQPAFVGAIKIERKRVPANNDFFLDCNFISRKWFIPQNALPFHLYWSLFSEIKFELCDAKQIKSIWTLVIQCWYTPGRLQVWMWYAPESWCDQFDWIELNWNHSCWRVPPIVELSSCLASYSSNSFEKKTDTRKWNIHDFCGVSHFTTK